MLWHILILLARCVLLQGEEALIATLFSFYDTQLQDPAITASNNEATVNILAGIRHELGLASMLTWQRNQLVREIVATFRMKAKLVKVRSGTDLYPFFDARALLFALIYAIQAN